jgi:hypothetical protein
MEFIQIVEESAIHHHHPILFLSVSHSNNEINHSYHQFNLQSHNQEIHPLHLNIFH